MINSKILNFRICLYIHSNSPQLAAIGNFIFYYDNALWHRKKRSSRFFETNKDYIIPIYYPKYSPEFNGTEECWRQSKNDILGSFILPSFEDFKKFISKYFRTKRFKFDRYSQIIMSLTIVQKL